MIPTITATYAAGLAVYFVAMSAYVISVRARTDTMLGANDKMPMLVAMRRHGNLAEYLPFAILVLALAEMAGVGALWINVAGIALVAGRLIHPFGITETGRLAPRVVGMLATFAAILIPAIGILSTTLA